MKKLLILLLIPIFAGCIEVRRCEPIFVYATIDSVYYQPSGFGVAEEWSGTATLIDVTMDGEEMVYYSTSYPVEEGNKIYMPKGCGYFQKWYPEYKTLN